MKIIAPNYIFFNRFFADTALTSNRLSTGQFVFHPDERFKNELRFLGTLQVYVYRAVFIFEFFKKL